MSQLQDNLNEILRQKNAYLIPNNLRSGITLLGVDGNLSLDVKKFATKEEMMADTVEDENELGLVYGPKITTLHDGASSSAILFPSEVVFDTAITTNKYMEVEMTVGGEWYTVDGNINVEWDTPGASFTIGDTRIEYETNDNMTFTVKEAYADVADKRIELPVEITFTSRYGAIPDEIFAFVKGDSNYFEGLYEWKDEIDYEYVDAVTDITVDTTNKRVASVNSEVYLHQTFEEFIREILPNYVDNPIPEGTEGLCYRVKSTGDIWLVTHTSSCYPVIDVTTKNVYISVSVPNNIGYKYKMNLEEGTISDYTVMPLDDVNITNAWGFPDTCQLLGNLSDIEILGDIFYHLSSGDMTVFGGYISWYFVTNDGQGNLVYDKDNPYTSWYQGEGETQSTQHMIYGHQSFLTWHHVKTEFTLEHANQLLPGVTAMGKHGIVIGDGSIYNNIALDAILESKMGNVTPNYVYGHLGSQPVSVIHKSSTESIDDLSINNTLQHVYNLGDMYSDSEHFAPEGYTYQSYGGWAAYKNYMAMLISNATTSAKAIMFYNLDTKIRTIVDLNGETYSFASSMASQNIPTTYIYKKDTSTNTLTIKAYDITTGTLIDTYTMTDAVISTNYVRYIPTLTGIYVIGYNSSTSKWVIYLNGELLSTFDKTANENPTGSWGLSYSPVYDIIYDGENYLGFMFACATVSVRVIDKTTGNVVDLEEFTATKTSSCRNKDLSGYFIIEPYQSSVATTTQSLYKIENGEIVLVNTTSGGVFYGRRLYDGYLEHNQYFISTYTDTLTGDDIILAYGKAYETDATEIKSLPLLSTYSGIYNNYQGTYRTDNQIYHYIYIDYTNFVTRSLTEDYLAVNCGTISIISTSKYILINNKPYIDRISVVEAEEAVDTTEDILGNSESEQSGGGNLEETNEEENGSSGGLQQEEDEMGLIGG